MAEIDREVCEVLTALGKFGNVIEDLGVWFYPFYSNFADCKEEP